MKTVGARVLVIDDDPVVRAFLRAVLGGDCSSFLEANSAAQARTICSTRSFDLAFVDLRLPDSDGVGLRTELAASAGTWIALSGDLDGAAQGRLLATGFDAAWQKPLELDLLIERLRALGWTFSAATAAPALIRAAEDCLSVFNDELGLRATGDFAILGALRQLMGGELDRERAILRAAIVSGNQAVVLDLLHRWSSSAAFCAAPRLQDIVDRMRSAITLQQHQPQLLDELENGIDATLAAIGKPAPRD